MVMSDIIIWSAKYRIVLCKTICDVSNGLNKWKW